MLTTDYGEAMDFDTWQREHTFRSILSWDHLRTNWKVAAKGGYIQTWMAYDYKRDVGNGTMAHMTRSRSKINTFYAQGEGEYYQPPLPDACHGTAGHSFTITPKL